MKIDGFRVKSMSVALSRYERKMLEKFRNMGLFSSLSEAVRFCVLYTYEHLLEMIRKGERVISLVDVPKTWRNSEIVFIRNGSNKYDKYVKVKNE